MLLLLEELVDVVAGGTGTDVAPDPPETALSGYPKLTHRVS